MCMHFKSSIVIFTSSVDFESALIAISLKYQKTSHSCDIHIILRLVQSVDQAINEFALKLSQNIETISSVKR